MQSFFHVRGKLFFDFREYALPKTHSLHLKIDSAWKTIYLSFWGPRPIFRVHHVRTNPLPWIKSSLKIARYCPLVIQGFSNFLGLFQGMKWQTPIFRRELFILRECTGWLILFFAKVCRLYFVDQRGPRRALVVVGHFWGMVLWYSYILGVDPSGVTVANEGL